MAAGTWSADAKSKEAERQISLEDLQARFRIDQETGAIYNRRTGNRVDIVHHFKGQTPIDPARRYRQVSIKVRGSQETVKIAAHRIVWADANGRWPDPMKVIDHIDGDRQNNKAGNLREVTQGENIAAARR